MTTPKNATLRVQTKPVVGTPLVEKRLNVVGVDRGFHAIAKAPIILYDGGDKCFKNARYEEADQTSGEQASEIKAVITLLEDAADTGLLTILAK